uniref:Uncharacterized protein n=1 Tax=Anguilla anguilla TaxID=7936 RepID=A0A0E9WBX4_ANGAN
MYFQILAGKGLYSRKRCQLAICNMLLSMLSFFVVQSGLIYTSSIQWVTE